MASAGKLLGSSAAVEVRGLRELNKALELADKQLKRELVADLKDATKPISDEAERLTLSRVRNMPKSEAWAKNRVGVTRDLVYVVPRKRGVSRGSRRRSKQRDANNKPLRVFSGPAMARPNLADLISVRSYQPALDNHVRDVEEAVDRLIGKVAENWGNF